MADGASPPPTTAVVAAGASEAWPLLAAYAARFISGDGRVIDAEAGGITTSEGQAYALFFALVANDKPLFLRLLRWTDENLAAAELGPRLPAWRWGRDERDAWGVLDDNSASDADLWIAYALIEAGRLWTDPILGARGEALLATIVRSEIEPLPGLGPSLLPAPRGFHPDPDTWRLNPSYGPLQLYAAFADARLAGPWKALRASTLKLLRARARHGFVDDWVGYHRTRGVIDDPEKGPIGSYDAIRVYLWAGMLDGRDRDAGPLGALLFGPRRSLEQRSLVPQRVDCRAPAPRPAAGPIGFVGALLPSLSAVDRARVLPLLEASRRGALYGDPPRYYDQNLLLFATGFVERRFRFDRRGRLHTPWSSPPR